MMDDDFEYRLNSILKTGRVNRTKEDNLEEMEVNIALSILRHASQNYADHLLQKIAVVASTEMTSLALAVLLANGPDMYLSNPTKKAAIKYILTQLTPVQLLEIVEYLKGGVLGRGLGSRPQKMIRHVMESWSEEMIENYMLQDQKELSDLVKLIHPRYRGRRGELIQILMNG
jgi:hypothetical protein